MERDTFVQTPCSLVATFSTIVQPITVAIMASVDAMGSTHLLEDPELPPRKRFKTSELPITATQKSTIDGLLHTIKKKGEYDLLRKKVWSQFEESVCLWNYYIQR